MALTLKTHEEIHAELTRPARLRILKTGLKLAERHGRADQKEAHVHRVNLMLITAAAGRQIFSGTNGRVLAAIAGLGKQPRGVRELREAGAVAEANRHTFTICSPCPRPK